MIQPYHAVCDAVLKICYNLYRSSSELTKETLKWFTENNCKWQGKSTYVSMIFLNTLYNKLNQRLLFFCFFINYLPPLSPANMIQQRGSNSKYAERGHIGFSLFGMNYCWQINSPCIKRNVTFCLPNFIMIIINIYYVYTTLLVKYGLIGDVTNYGLWGIRFNPKSVDFSKIQM